MQVQVADNEKVSTVIDCNERRATSERASIPTMDESTVPYDEIPQSERVAPAFPETLTLRHSDIRC